MPPMVHPTHIVSVGAALLFASGAVAQVAKGAPAPEFAFEKVWNDGPQTFADMAGKVVILDFAQTW